MRSSIPIRWIEEAESRRLVLLESEAKQPASDAAPRLEFSLAKKPALTVLVARMTDASLAWRDGLQTETGRKAATIRNPAMSGCRTSVLSKGARIAVLRAGSTEHPRNCALHKAVSTVGSFLISILRRCPDLHGAPFELPRVARERPPGEPEGARVAIVEADLSRDQRLGGHNVLSTKFPGMSRLMLN